MINANPIYKYNNAVVGAVGSALGEEFKSAEAEPIGDGERI
jgi:hypothetical protein